MFKGQHCKYEKNRAISTFSTTLYWKKKEIIPFLIANKGHPWSGWWSTGLYRSKIIPCFPRYPNLHSTLHQIGGETSEKTHFIFIIPRQAKDQTNKSFFTLWSLCYPSKVCILNPVIPHVQYCTKYFVTCIKIREDWSTPFILSQILSKTLVCPQN